jgi:hypothetical protein
MSDKEILVLNDKQIIPTDDYIFSLIGEKKILWQNIMRYASENYKNISGSWNYYNDGKQWLYKLVQKKKTIFWAGILKDTFRITFYFGDKAEPVIDSSDLPQAIKDSFKTSRKYGAIRAITIKALDSEDADNVLKLIAIKHKVK